ncbi:MAG: hypothetical protein JWO08_2936, partial [Verrucomicrobiaceae bacterium]|nr:hypothetical protein [Verrucomicrobiaceae bacterium]
AIRTSEDGLLRIMPVGQLDEFYQKRLDALHLGQLYQDGVGQPLIAAFKEMLQNARLFDVVFIDSRTGFSDESGICTRDLGDYLMVVMGLNRQNQEGTAAFLRSLKQSGATPHELRVILSPVPNGEEELVEHREKEAKKVLKDAYGKKVDLSLQIPYHPRLALTEEPHIFRHSRGYLYEAYTNIEGEVLSILGMTVEGVREKVTKAVEKKNIDTVIHWLKQLPKLGGDTNAIESVFGGEDGLIKLCIEKEARALRLYLAKVLPASSWIVQTLASKLSEQKMEEANMFYILALKGRSNDAKFLASYALFLSYVYKSFDEAEVMFKRALEVAPNDFAILDNYANFLTHIRKDYGMAEVFYKRALEEGPEQASIIGNCSQFLFLCRRWEEAENKWDQCFTTNPVKTVLCELWFYACAHMWKTHPECLATLKSVLQNGARSPEWYLSENVRVAQDEGHPDSNCLEALARVICDGADIEILDDFESWKSGRFEVAKT